MIGVLFMLISGSFVLSILVLYNFLKRKYAVYKLKRLRENRRKGCK